MLSQDRCSGMDSGRGPGLSQHSLPAGDLLDARLAFMFSRAAQRIGSAGVGTNLFLEGAQREPRIHFGGAGQSGLLGQLVTFGRVRLGVVDRLGGHVQPVFQVREASDIPVSVIRAPLALLAASAIPKSATRAEPSWSRMFSGLMSRWTTPCRWA